MPFQKGHPRFDREFRAERTHCPHGHVFNKPNTYLWRGVKLCRRCRGEALRQRSAGSRGKAMENGVVRALKPRERVPPKKGGRPRLLDDQELELLYRVYKARGLSIGELARQLASTRESGTRGGYYQSILYGWRRLGYELRPRGVQTAMSRFGTDGTESKPRKQRCVAENTAWGPRRGKRCQQFAKRDSRYCRSHAPIHDT